MHLEYVKTVIPLSSLQNQCKQSNIPKCEEKLRNIFGVFLMLET